jgi:hypothetical protein
MDSSILWISGHDGNGARVPFGVLVARVMINILAGWLRHR